MRVGSLCMHAQSSYLWPTLFSVTVSALTALSVGPGKITHHNVTQFPPPSGGPRLDLPRPVVQWNGPFYSPVKTPPIFKWPGTDQLPPAVQLPIKGASLPVVQSPGTETSSPGAQSHKTKSSRGRQVQNGRPQLPIGRVKTNQPSGSPVRKTSRQSSSGSEWSRQSSRSSQGQLTPLSNGPSETSPASFTERGM